MTSELQDYRLDRTGRPPLSFKGEFLAGAYGEEYIDERRKNPRWHDLELYRTVGGRYVLHVRYGTTWKDEVGHDEAVVVESPADLVGVLGGWDPTAVVRGYPPGAQFEEKQRYLLAEVRQRFDRVVSDLFAQLGPEFSERVE